MVFVETTLFTKRIIELEAENQLRQLQNELLVNPELGDVIHGLEGLRKVRMPLPGRGKRGASRVLYLVFPEVQKIIFLLIYTKNEFTDLSPQMKKAIRSIITQVRKEFEHEKTT